MITFNWRAIWEGIRAGLIGSAIVLVLAALEAVWH